MSQESVKLYERLCEAINAREVPGALLAPGYSIETVATAVTEKTYRGAEGVREWISDYFDVFAEGARFEVETIIADGDDFVVGRVGLVGTGARSGAPLHLRWINVIWFSGGKATRSVGYGNRAEALEAVGLAA